VTREAIITKRCQFTVQGPLQVGTVYATGIGPNEAAVIAHAKEIAAKRSGDPSPVFVRFA
jgi:hypothetical protein